MGDELHVKRGARLDVVASAQLNPDVDQLDRLELVVMSDVAETVPAEGKDKLDLHRELKADHSMWIAVRAFGKRQEPRNMIVAHSAPVYVVVDGEPTWKASAVPARGVSAREARRADDDARGSDPGFGAVGDAHAVIGEWDNGSLIKPQISQAHALYQSCWSV
jgi:hypothetical protein